MDLNPQTELRCSRQTGTRWHRSSQRHSVTTYRFLASTNVRTMPVWIAGSLQSDDPIGLPAPPIRCLILRQTAPSDEWKRHQPPRGRQYDATAEHGPVLPASHLHSPIRSHRSTSRRARAASSEEPFVHDHQTVDGALSAVDTRRWLLLCDFDHLLPSSFFCTADMDQRPSIRNTTNTMR